MSAKQAASRLLKNENGVEKKPNDLGIFRQYECALAIAEKPVGFAGDFVAAGAWGQSQVAGHRLLAATEKIPNMAIVVPKGIGREMIIQGNSSPQSTDHG